MKTFSVYFFTLSLVLAACVAKGQPSALLQKDIIFDQPHENLGLSQRSINCMIEDQKGYLWIGTWEGLMLYDGYTTTIFQTKGAVENTLGSNKITALYEDHSGKIWVGTLIGGLYQYDRATGNFTHYQYAPTNDHSISNNNVWSITESKDGNIWVGTQNGLNVFDPEKKEFTRFYHSDDPKSISYNFITSLFIDEANNLWVGTEKGLNKLNLDNREAGFDKYYYHLDEDDGPTNNYVYKITSYKHNGEEVICWSTKKGLKLLDREGIHNYLYPESSLRFSFVRTLYTYEKSDQFIMLGSEAGLSLFNPKTREFKSFFGDYNERVSLSHNTVTSLLIDHTGVLWVGTKKGINKFDTYNKNFELFETSSFDDSRSIITGIEGNGEGKYWVSTMGGGLFLFDPDEGETTVIKDLFTRYKIDEKGANDFSDFIQTIDASEPGVVWVGTAGDGLYKGYINKNSKTVTKYEHYNYSTTEHKISDDYIMSLADDNHGGMWVGTWSGGLNRINADGTVTQFKESVLSQAPLVAMYQDGNTLWVGTRGKGLLSIESVGGKLNITQYRQSKNGLNNDFINVIYKAQNGRLWIGSEGGLNEFDKNEGQWKSYDISRSENEVVVGMLEDEQGKLWLSDWNGITVFNPNDSAESVHHYDMRDRIQGGFFYNNVCYKDDKGRLFFGGNNGLNIIKPDEVNENPFPPKVVLTDFDIYNKEVVPNEEFNGRVILQEPINQAQQINLDYDENAISFEFAALHYAAPEKNQYAYRLVGYDNNWEYTNSQRRFANYTNLNYGDYVFEVKASNNDGVWSDDVKQITIHISPPWWKTIWAVLAYFVLAMAVLLLFRHLIIVRTNYINDIKMERLKREGVLKMNQSKLKFFTNISHEFRTPLTLILGPLEKLIESGMGGKYVKDELDIINKNAQRLLRLVNQLLDFRKAESGKLTLKVAEGNIVKFVKEIKLMFEGLAEKLGVNFEFYTNSDDIKVWYDRDQCEKILFNLLSNSFKHVPKNGVVKIMLEETEKEVFIKIEDNGGGIAPENIGKIFNRFYSEGEDKSGTGIGLALTRTLVKMHHGDISVNSVVNQSTVFTVALKKGNAHFTDADMIQNFKDSEYIGHYQSVADLEVELMDVTPTEEKPTTDGNLKKLMIVEDNPEVRGHIKSMFAGKYEVIEAENGRVGLELAESQLPDVIVSDVMMPEMDGIALCKAIKKNTATSHIPIILLTARTSLIYKVEGLESGADDYITKPFNYQVLSLKVKNLVSTRDQLRRHFNDNQTLDIEPKKVTFSSADELFIEKALESVEKNMSNTAYSVEDFGEDVGMSRMQIYRKLKALTGQSANEFIRTIRLKRAAQLIERNEFTIAEVTYRVGFQDLQYFRSCFKKYFGVNPSEYGRSEEEEENTVEEEQK
ncbi:response regulator [Fulvivirga maritima]|uniref:hybrid sensor histidine kinase/response regulator transcription factor n=1 Tax=Fulvivirga maritima TaxID=2904247 RepID=UPI001F3CEF39|nr:two-component regulator propeller domain-containing protein [Fulvivirga maritima]UII25317.1 response regulator [Fulvivirga maritima]